MHREWTLITYSRRQIVASSIVNNDWQGYCYIYELFFGIEFQTLLWELFTNVQSIWSVNHKTKSIILKQQKLKIGETWRQKHKNSMTKNKKNLRSLTRHTNDQILIHISWKRSRFILNYDWVFINQKLIRIIT